MLTMEDLCPYRLISQQHHQQYWMSSVAVVQKIAVQRGAHAVNMVCTTHLCGENFVVLSVQTHSCLICGMLI